MFVVLLVWVMLVAVAAGFFAHLVLVESRGEDATLAHAAGFSLMFIITLALVVIGQEIDPYGHAPDAFFLALMLFAALTISAWLTLGSQYEACDCDEEPVR